MNIIIIGAGATGLMAAYELVKNGHQVVVLEARDRIGGRICTVTNTEFSIPIDTGAEFIHGDVPITFSLLREAGISSKEMTGEMYQVEKGRLKHENFFDDDWDTVLAELGKLKHDMTIGEFLDQKFPGEKFKHLRSHLKRYIEGYNAADLTQASAMALYQEWSEEKEPTQYHPVGGYGRMIEYLHTTIVRKKGVCHLQSVVSDVQWKQNNVIVRTTDGRQYVGEKILITIPVSLLASSSISFDPPLQSVTHAAQQIGVGGVIKYLFEFHEAFWEAETYGKMKSLMFLFSDAKIPTWWTQSPEKTPMLTGWLGGPAVENIPNDESLLFEGAVNALAYIFNTQQQDIRHKIKAWRIDHWLSDPFAKGAYSYDKLESKSARKLMNIPVERTVYFAGEALYSGPHTGTVEAALTSGRDVATRMISDHV